MRILILDTYYPKFLSSYYEHHSELAQRPYDEQLSVLLNQCFGTSNFYSTNLAVLGHEAAEIVTNCEPLQARWAVEHGLKLEPETRWQYTKRRGIVPWLRRTRSTGWFERV